MNDVYVRVIPMEGTIRGAVKRDKNGDYNIYLNANLSSEMQGEAYRHELHHIEENHFSCNQSLLVCEAQAEYGI